MTSRASSHGLSPRGNEESWNPGSRRAGAIPDGTRVRVAGAVIARQRPGTAKGFVFLGLEDETGIANVLIIMPRLFERDHTVVVHNPFLLIEGTLQNLENVVSVKAESISLWSLLARSRIPTTSIKDREV